MEKEFSGDFWSYDERIEAAKKIHFKRLDGITYLDHAGATLYSECQLANLFQDLSTAVYGNPHSRSPSSTHSTEIIEDVRNRVLKHFNVSSDDYAVIFTSNCTAALKLLAESFCFSGNTEIANACLSNDAITNLKSSQPAFVYLVDNHTSVIGVREIMKSREVSFEHVTAKDVNSFKFCRDARQEETSQNVLPSTNNLFAFPAQSNFSGQKYPLSWIQEVRGHSGFASRHGNWCVLLDAASHLTTSTIDLKQYHPDFVALSFYKIFGYPTGLGALLVKTSSTRLLKKNYFGGGTVEASLTTEDFHIKRKGLSDRFEDGTLPFLEILAVKHGFDSLLQVTGSLIRASTQAYELARHVYGQLISWRYTNGRPLAVMYHNERFTSCATQGPIVNFNLLNCDGSFIGFALVEKLAQVCNIHFRTGCFCNMGACEQHLALTAAQVKDNLKAGHVCGDDVDLVDGQPTGSIRVSFGYCSTFGDAREFLDFIRKSFLEANVSELSDNVANTDSQEEIHVNERALCQSEPETCTLNDEVRCLVGLRIYPVKSCGGFALTEAEVGPRGLVNDRQWMIINDLGACISQKREPRLCCIQPSVDKDNKSLTLSFPGFHDLRIGFQDESKKVSSVPLCHGKVCGDRVVGSDCGENAAEWLQSVLDKQNLRLVQQKENDERTMNRKSTSVSEEELPGKLSLANEGQYLLIGTASLKLLQSQMRTRFGKGDGKDEDGCMSEQELIERFRPNLIVGTNEPFEEEKWTTVTIGSHTFVNEGLCNRCQMICINQTTGQRSKEPLLSLFTLPGRKSTFGILLRQVEGSSIGRLAVGDIVSPASQRESPV